MILDECMMGRVTYNRQYLPLRAGEGVAAGLVLFAGAGAGEGEAAGFLFPSVSAAATSDRIVSNISDYIHIFACLLLPEQ